MFDFYYQLRLNMIEIMQVSLRQIRLVLGFGVQEFGSLIGLTRQTINNLETNKSEMSASQYIAICAVIDHYLGDKPELVPIVTTILCSNEKDSESKIFEELESGSLLKKWFLCFPDDSKLHGLISKKKSLSVNDDFRSIAENYRIFLDKSILIEEKFFDGIQSLAVAMKDCDNRFIVPLRVIESIQRDFINTSEEVASKARLGMNMLMQLQGDNLLEIRGEESDSNEYATFVSVFAKFKNVNRLAILTQDKSLANQLINLNNDVIGGFNILALKIDDAMIFNKWEFVADNDDGTLDL